MENSSRSIGNNLRKILDEKKISVKDLAEMVEVSQTHLSYVLNNRRGASLELLDRIAKALDVMMYELLKDAGGSEYKTTDLVPFDGKLVHVPFLGRIPAGQPLECEENIIGFIDTPESEVSVGNYFYLRVTGDSMVGSGIMNGYTVLVRKQSDVESGEIAVVRVNSDEATLKRVKKLNGQIILYPDNPKYEPILLDSDDAEIIGKVVKVVFDPNKKY